MLPLWPPLASAARFCACLMSPDQPTTKQISPPASALRYSEEWNFRTDGRTLATRSAAFSRSPGSVEFGLRPSWGYAAERMASEEASMCTPQSLNLASSLG